MVIVDPAKAVVTLPDAYLIGIGKVCVQWGNLEAVMELALTKLAGMDIWDTRPKIMISHMAWPMRMDIFAAMADQLVADHPRLSVRPESS